MEDLTVYHVLQLCMSLGANLGAPVALAPVPGTGLYQLISMIEPISGLVLCEYRNVFASPRRLSDVEKFLVRGINLTNLRMKARVEIQQMGANADG